VHVFRAPPQSATKALLTDCKLPTRDLTDQHFQHFFGCGQEENPAGVVGVEVLGTVGLLRSLAVAESARGRGCGKRLVQEAELYATRQGVQELYLLTTTAHRLFESLGYAEVARDTAPSAIKATSEFSSICPGSATLMRKYTSASYPVAQPHPLRQAPQARDEGDSAS
jgi:amino-acid N-acetyltransferase